MADSQTRQPREKKLRSAQNSGTQNPLDKLCRAWQLRSGGQSSRTIPIQNNLNVLHKAGQHGRRPAWTNMELLTEFQQMGNMQEVEAGSDYQEGIQKYYLATTSTTTIAQLVTL